MSKACPRSNAKMLADVEKTYDTTLYMLDDGMWTIYEITKRAVAKAPSEHEANQIVEALKARDAAKAASGDQP